MQSNGLVMFGIFIIILEIILSLISGINSIFLHLNSNLLMLSNIMLQYWAYILAFGFASIFAGAFNTKYYILFIISFELLAFLLTIGVV